MSDTSPTPHELLRRAILRASSSAEDERCASAVAAFTGDINAAVTGTGGETLLCCAIKNRELTRTLFAFANRGDVNLNVVCGGQSLLATMADFQPGRVQFFMDLFPGIDQNCGDWVTALARSAYKIRADVFWLVQDPLYTGRADAYVADMIAMIDAGADLFATMRCPATSSVVAALWDDCVVTESPMTSTIVSSRFRAALDTLAVHVHWGTCPRRAWLLAVVTLGNRWAEGHTRSASPLLAAVLGDADRVSLSSDPAAHRTLSDYALVVALFLPFATASVPPVCNEWVW